MKVASVGARTQQIKFDQQQQFTVIQVYINYSEKKLKSVNLMGISDDALTIYKSLPTHAKTRLCRQRISFE
jgi:hypothetical protein